MDDSVYSLLVMKRSFKTEKNERKTFFWLEITWPRNGIQCFLTVSRDFFSLEELVIQLQMAFPECMLESTSIQCAYGTYMNVLGIEQDVLKDCAECHKNLI